MFKFLKIFKNKKRERERERERAGEKIEKQNHFLQVAARKQVLNRELTVTSCFILSRRLFWERSIV